MDLSVLGITVDLNYVILGAIAYAVGLASVMAFGRLRALASAAKAGKRKDDDDYHADDAVVEAVVLEYTRRLKDYDRAMAEMKAKLDIVEMRVLHQPQQYVTPPSQPAQPHAQAVSEPVAVTQRPVVSPGVSTAATTIAENAEGQNGTTDYILKLLVERPRTSREVQHAIGRTREHTARLMKKLNDSGLVSRDMNSKPFRYAITQAGQARLGTATRQQLVPPREVQ